MEVGTLAYALFFFLGWFTLYSVSLGRKGVGFSGGAHGKEPACQCRRGRICGFNPWVGKIPWRRAGQPIPVFLPGESPWTEEPDGLQSMGSQRVGHGWSHWARTQGRSILMQGPCWGRYSVCSVVQAEASLLAHLEQGHWVLGGIRVVTLPCFVLMTLSCCSDRCLPRCSHLWFCHLSFSTPSCFHDCSFFFCSFLGLFKHFMAAWFIII